MLIERGAEPGQPVPRADDDAQRHRRACRHAAGLDRPEPVHRHRLRGRRPRHRRRRRGSSATAPPTSCSPAAPKRRSRRWRSPPSARMGALSGRNDDPGGASRPFDVDRDGFVMGEGAAFLVLERLRPGRSPGAPASTARCSATAATPTPTTSPRRRPAGRGAAACMQLALDDAGLAPAAIGHVNAHGTSTPLNDAAEAEAIAKVFGEHAAAGHVDQGRHRPPHRRRRRGRGGGLRCWPSGTGWCRPPPTTSSTDPDITLDVVAGAPRDRCRARPCRTRSASAATTPPSSSARRRPEALTPVTLDRRGGLPVAAGAGRRSAPACASSTAAPSPGSASRAASTAAPSARPRARCSERARATGPSSSGSRRRACSPPRAPTSTRAWPPSTPGVGSPAPLAPGLGRGADRPRRRRALRVGPGAAARPGRPRGR